MDSEFLKWFEEQFGPEPITTEAERQEMLHRAAVGRAAQSRLDAQSDYHHRRTAALYAWQAARKAKEESR